MKNRGSLAWLIAAPANTTCSLASMEPSVILLKECKSSQALGKGRVEGY
jgi:hypothetical protein